MSTVNHYQICGLRLDSTIPLPELRAHRASRGAAPADFELVPAQIARPAEEGPVVMVSENLDGTLWMKCTRTSTGYRFDFPAFAEFFVDAGGRRVASAARPGTAPETLRHLFLDQVMPLLLNLRGTESLHGSAVLVGGGVCAFVGRSGQGKSTLAAAFHQAGITAVCDDCLLLHENAGKVQAQSIYPGLRLWEDSRVALFGDSCNNTPVSQFSDKVRISTSEAGASESGPQPLRRVYALQRDEEGGALKAPVIEPLSMRDALMALIEYAFRLELSSHGMLLRQLDLLERVARTVPVRLLRLPHDLAALPAARSLVLDDLAHA